MNLVSLDSVSKAPGGDILFEGVSLGIDSGERIGLVGRNGSGKSTFLRLLAGLLEPDAGTMARKRGLSVSLLEQRHSFDPEETLAGFLYSGESAAARRAQERHPVPDDKDAEGISALERRYASFCSELGLPSPDSRLVTFSGGMVKKAALARALAPTAELLLLDEPTNHLDIETIEWLERRLAQGPSAFVLVTHDRWFLDAACTTMMDIDRRSLSKYPGSYADYLERRVEREASLERTESRRLAVLKGELAWLKRGARARAGKSERRKEEIRELQAGGLEREKRIEGFSTIHRRLGKKVLELHGVAKSYYGRRVVAPFSRIFKAGERVGVVGPNGSGKTTFLDMVSGRVEADAGRVDRGPTTHFAYFDQTAASIDKSKSVLAFVADHAERIRMRDGSTLTPEQLLERFLFPRAMLETSLSRLSGGELRRLQLVRLLAESPNFLLLDEPTNDLDIETIELLEDFLQEFPGCVLAVSHDRAFLDRLADFLLVFDGEGDVREVVGGYGDYRALLQVESSTRQKGSARTGAALSASGASEPRRKRLGYAERKEYEGILDEISALEAEKRGLEAVFSAPASDPAGIERANRRYAELVVLIEARTARWEELAARA